MGAGLAPALNQTAGLMGLSPIWMTLLRTTIAFVSLMIFFPRLWGYIWRQNLRYWAWCALLAITGLTLPLQLLSWSVQHTTTTLSGILVSTIPLMVVLFSVLGLGTTREKKNPLALMGGFVGVCLLLFPHIRIENLWRQETFWGNMAALGAAALFAINLLLIERSPSSKKMEDGILVIGMSALLSIPMLLMWPGETWEPLGLTLVSLLSLVGLSFFSTAIAFPCLFILVEREGPTLTAQINYLSPLIVTVIGIFVLGEHLSWQIGLGCVVILGSLFYQTRNSSRH